MIEQRIQVGLAWMLLAFLSAGCAHVGPPSIRGTRAAYNEAVVETNTQQVLAMIVRLRYGEPTGLLAVSGITANVRIQAQAGAEIGFGPDSGYEGNLVPLSAGFVYEENPTISYTPVQGQKYMRHLLSPLPLDLTLLVLNAMRDSPHAMTLLVRSINGMRNPDFLPDPSMEGDPRFKHLVDLMAEMALQGRATWSEEPGSDSPFRLFIAGGTGAHDPQTAGLFRLLGYPEPEEADAVIALPVLRGLGRGDEPSVTLETRSLYDLLRIAAASVEVPEAHVESGVAEQLPPVGAAGRSIRIRRSEALPEGSLTAVRHHGWWYSIDGADTESKRTFRIVESLLSVRIADAVDHRDSTPVLTVPVSR
jgi:hypothetical protein